jgi:hypothetical protein
MKLQAKIGEEWYDVEKVVLKSKQFESMWFNRHVDEIDDIRVDTEPQEHQSEAEETSDDAPRPSIKAPNWRGIVIDELTKPNDKEKQWKEIANEALNEFIAWQRAKYEFADEWHKAWSEEEESDKYYRQLRDNYAMRLVYNGDSFYEAFERANKFVECAKSKGL